MSGIEIDLYSDTQSKPTPEMRKAMAEAEVGDEQQGTGPNCHQTLRDDRGTSG